MYIKWIIAIIFRVFIPYAHKRVYIPQRIEKGFCLRSILLRILGGQCLCKL